MATSDNAAKDIPQLINNLNKTNHNQNNNLKNLYQSIGTRVSRLREINENYEKKISEQGSELKELEETIRQKEKLLEEIRFHKGNLTRGFKDEQLNELKEKDTIKFYNKEKVNTSTKESEEFFNKQYNEMLNNKDFVMKINENHIQNDPSLKKTKKNLISITNMMIQKIK